MTTSCPNCASAAPRAAVDVVFPTPPFPEVTTTTLAIVCISWDDSYSVQRGDPQLVTFQPRLDSSTAQPFIHRFSSQVVTIDRQKLGFDPAAEDACSRVPVRACHGSAAQCAVNMYRSSGDKLGTGADRTEDRHVAVRKEN